MNYAERLKLLDLESLEHRRLKFDLKMYHKIIHGLVNLDKNKFFVFLPNLHSTRGHDLQLQIPVYRSNHLANTFASRAIDCWNHLPAKTVTATSINAFSFYLNSADCTQYLHG